MEIVIKVLQLILALSLLVFVHELGHYFTARMFGIRVEKFYLFFDAGGFAFFRFRVGETEFGLGWVPFGGYCKISGMIDESMDTEAMKQPPQPWEFRTKPAWQRLIVMVGGVVMNVLAAIVIYAGICLYWGEAYIDNRDAAWGWTFNELAREIGFVDGDRIVSFDGKPVTGPYNKVFLDMVIGQVSSVEVTRGGSTATVTVPEGMTARLLDSPGFMTPREPFVIAGLPAGSDAPFAAGDSLIALNGEPTIWRHEWEAALAGVAGSEAEVTLVRDIAGVETSETVRIKITPQGQLGVLAQRMLPVSRRDFTLVEAVPAGFRRAGTEIADYWRQLKMIVNPRTEAYKGVGSLITIGSIFPGTWDWLRFWNVTAFLSIILAVMNILPIPALDGGHVVFLIWEVVTRRRPSDKVLERAQVVGMILLMGLMVLAFWNDIYRFFIK